MIDVLIDRSHSYRYAMHESWLASKMHYQEKTSTKQMQHSNLVIRPSARIPWFPVGPKVQTDEELSSLAKLRSRNYLRAGHGLVNRDHLVAWHTGYCADRVVTTPPATDSPR
jgi:hypothetical protein